MSGWQWVLVITALGLVARGLYVLLTGHKSTEVTWVNGVKQIEHEDPATGRGMGAAILFLGAIVFLVAATPGRLGRTARGALEFKDAAETTYATWAYRIFLPIFVPLVALVAGLFVVMSFEELFERRWGQWLLAFSGGVVAFAVAGYLAWFWWGLVT